VEAIVELSPEALLDPKFLDSGCAVGLPSGRTLPVEVADALLAMAGLGQSVVAFATSGTTGAPRWVVLTKKALRFSAESVCRHLRVERGDRWICPLPVGHVGGAGVYLRASISGGVVIPWEGKWSAEKFRNACAEETVHWASLVPTQVYDLVASESNSPDSLRGVVVGGGALDDEMKRRALNLGWPILSSFGMTESASQIATELPGENGGMEVINGWDVRVDGSSTLQIRGGALFSGWLERCVGGEFSLRSPLDDAGWFTTRDRVEILQEGGKTFLRPCGRVDDFIKVLGELVSLQRLEAVLHRQVRGRGGDVESVAVVAIPDDRMGCRPVMMAEKGQTNAAEWLDLFNKSEILPVERLTEVIFVRAFPRSDLGKIQRNRLLEMALDHQ